MVRLKPHRNILIVCSHLNIAGGLERMAVSLANVLSENRYTVSLLIIGTAKESFYPINNMVAITLLDADFGISAESSYMQGKLDFISDVTKFRKAIHTSNADYIITTEYPQTVAAILAGMSKKYKIIAWQHSSYLQPKSKVWKILSDYAYKKVKAIVCLNKDEEKIYKALTSKTYVIPNFINLPVQKSQPNPSATLLTVARLVQDKGIDLLEGAALIVFKKYPNWQWKIIGDGPLLQQVESFIEKNKLQENLFIFSSVNDLSKEYSNASIYIMTSRRETFGMVLIEAMSYGLPCVSFDCNNGPRHIITNNIDGILVEKEAPLKLAEAICMLIEDKEKRNRMSAAALQNVKRFSSEIILQKWEALFQNLSAE